MSLGEVLGRASVAVIPAVTVITLSLPQSSHRFGSGAPT
jgi:hypothetical protein